MSTQSDDPAPLQIVVETIEGRRVRVELPGGTTIDWPLDSLPDGVREGDVLTLQIDHAATHKRRERAQAQLDALNAGGPTDGIDV